MVASMSETEEKSEGERLGTTIGEGKSTGIWAVAAIEDMDTDTVAGQARAVQSERKPEEEK
jgi:hypothetical protein